MAIIEAVHFLLHYLMEKIKCLDGDLFFVHDSEEPTLMKPLQPCCEGVSTEYYCGSVDERGEKKYGLCEKPEFSFFWEGVHLSQNGWYRVYTMLYSSLLNLNDTKL